MAALSMFAHLHTGDTPRRAHHDRYDYRDPLQLSPYKKAQIHNHNNHRAALHLSQQNLHLALTSNLPTRTTKSIMRSALALAVLLAFATAAPLEMAADGKYTKYGIYASYRPYTTYGKYPTAAAADAEAATMQLETRVRRAEGRFQAQNMDMGERRGQIVPEEVQARRVEDGSEKQVEAGYGKYSPYWSYGRYPQAVDGAANMDADADAVAGVGVHGE
ncbi:hypothetical protein J1614_000266 [Plenodomus biglobosus]|nr:hypothetical protein J1614_000266 [Plenodomus biglobosus]